MSYYVSPSQNGMVYTTSASPWYACGSTWTLSSSSPPLQANWSGPYSYWDLCIDHNFYWSGSLSMTDTGGFSYSASPSYQGSYNTGHYDYYSTATVSMGWSYVEIVGYP